MNTTLKDKNMTSEDKNMTPKDKYEERNSILLAGVGGAVDAIGYLTFSHLFMGFMTGNTVFLGINVAQGNWQQAGRDIFPILMFIVGAVIGNLLIKKVVPALILEAGLLAATLCWQILVHNSLSAPAAAYLSHSTPAWFATNAAAFFFPGVALLATAMGIQSGMFQRVGSQAVGVTAVTGNVLGFASLLASSFPKKSGAGSESKDGDQSQRRGVVLGVWTCYVVCAAIAALAVKYESRESLLFPLVVLGIVIALNIPRSSGRPT